MKKKALITGITGQDGSYLAEFLLKKNYTVHGIKRKSSSYNTSRIDHLIDDKKYKSNFFLHYGDLTDLGSIISLIKRVKPDEIYNLAAQSHVMNSFQIPDYTTQVNALGTLKLLEAIKILNLISKVRFYQASTSELFGNSSSKKQSENTPFHPESPYATSKLFAYWIVRNYRTSYGLFASNGILFNHESPRRGETFVTRKITIALSKIAFGLKDFVYVGNLYAKRDWGHARDYAKMQWKILQTKKSDDYVISSGKNYTVKYFFELCCKYLKIRIKWKGVKEKEIALVESFDKKICPNLKKNQIILKVDKRYFRPSEVNNLKGDSSKAQKYLNWKIKSNIKDLVKDMMNNDYNHYRKIFFS